MRSEECKHYATMRAFSIVAGGVTMRSFRFPIVFDSNEARDEYRRRYH